LNMNPKIMTQPKMCSKAAKCSKLGLQIKTRD
jgi:hypothetical protein